MATQDPFTALGFTPSAAPSTTAPQAGVTPPAAPSTTADPFASLGFTATPTAPAKAPGFVDRVKADFATRRKMLDEINNATVEGKQTVPEALLQHAGQVVGGAFDIETEAAKSVTPDFIKKPVKAGLGVLGKAVNVVAEPLANKMVLPQETIDKASKLQGDAAVLYHLAGSETDPVKKAKLRADAKAKADTANAIFDANSELSDSLGRKARNVDAAINIGSLLPVGEGSKLAAPLAGRTLEKVGTVVEKSGLDSAQAARQAFAQDLVRPIESKASKIADVERTTEKGMGIFKSSTVAPTAEEARMAEAVANVPGVNPKATLQQNYNALQSENIINAGQLVSDVKLNDFVIPKREALARVNAVKNTLASSPVIVGDAEKTADKLLAGAQKFINANDGTGSGLLQARKDYDQWVLTQKPAAFDAKAENAFTIANREIRKSMTNMLDEYAPNAKVKESLARQSAIYEAMENVAPKAAEEANTAVGRALQRVGKVLGTKNKIVQGIAAGVGIGGLGAAATFAPIVAGVAVPLYILYRAGRLVMNPSVRIGIGKLLEQYGHLLNPEDVKALTSAVADYGENAPKSAVKFPNKQGGFISLPGVGSTPTVPIPVAGLPQAIESQSSYTPTIPQDNNNGNDPQRANESIQKYAPSTQASIQKGLQDGTVRFESSPTGGEYIYSADKSFGKKNLKQKIDTIVNNVSDGAFKVASEIIKTPVRVGMSLADVPRTFAGKEPLKPVNLGILGKAESAQRSAKNAVDTSTDNFDAFAKVLGIASSSILDVAALGKVAQLATKAIGGNGGKAVKAVSEIFEPGGNTSNTMATYDKYIAAGDYQPTQVYSDVAGKVFKPEIAKQIINDARLAISEKGFPQLGNELALQLDPATLTPQTMIDTAKNLIGELLKSHVLQRGSAALPAVLGGAAVTGAGVAATTPRKITYTSDGQENPLPAPVEPAKPVSVAPVKPQLLANALTALESSGGTNKASADPGEKKWLTGLTDVAIKELKRLGRLPAKFNKNSEKDVIDASVKYFHLMQERNPGKSPGEVYVDHYWTQSTSTEQRQKKIDEFNSIINYNG